MSSKCSSSIVVDELATASTNVITNIFEQTELDLRAVMKMLQMFIIKGLVAGKKKRPILMHQLQIYEII